jgi:hypothetical protein
MERLVGVIEQLAVTTTQRSRVIAWCGGERKDIAIVYVDGDGSGTAWLLRNAWYQVFEFTEPCIERSFSSLLDAAIQGRDDITTVDGIVAIEHLGLLRTAPSTAHFDTTLSTQLILVAAFEPTATDPIRRQIAMLAKGVVFLGMQRTEVAQ